MERLTFDGNFCDIAMCRERPGGVFCKNGPCSQRKTWERLREIEDILGPDYDLDRLRALMEADRDGLVRIARRPPLESECCGNCGHFQRITGTARGRLCCPGIYREALAREIHTLPVPEGVPAISKEDGGTWKT